MRGSTHRRARESIEDLYPLSKDNDDGTPASRNDIINRVNALIDEDRFHIAEPFEPQFRWTFANPAIAKLLFKMFFNSSSKIGIKESTFINTLVNSKTIISVCLCIHHAPMCYTTGEYVKDYQFGDEFTVGKLLPTFLLEEF